MSRETEQQVRLFTTKTDDLASVPGTYWPPASTYMMWPVHALSLIQNNKKKKIKTNAKPKNASVWHGCSGFSLNTQDTADFNSWV